MAIRNKKYIVRLSQEERETLMKRARGGKAAARKITRSDVAEGRRPRGWSGMDGSDHAGDGPCGIFRPRKGYSPCV